MRVALQFFLLLALLLVIGPNHHGTVRGQDGFSLEGEWQIDYTLPNFNRQLNFQALKRSTPFGGAGFYVISQGPILIPIFLTPAAWQQPTPTSFSFTGEVEFLIGDFGRQTGTLTFKGEFQNNDLISGTVLFVTDQIDQNSPLGFLTMTGKFAGKRMAPPAADFSLNLPSSILNVKRGDRGTIALEIARSGNFTGNVTVIAPDTSALMIKLSPTQQTTTGSMLVFNYRIKKQAVIGQHQVIFTGRDDDGRQRTAMLLITIQ